MKYLKKFEQQTYRSLLNSLEITKNNLDELDHLSEYTNLKKLDCSINNLKSLPELPESLTYLNCVYNDLQSLPELPKSLTHLNCSYNNLQSLPELPESLTDLNCVYNDLKSLPELPTKSLTYLNCSNNNDLKTLPELPKSLITLYCENTSLPFEDLKGYKKWYSENKHIIKTEGLEYAYVLYRNLNKYNI